MLHNDNTHNKVQGTELSNTQPGTPAQQLIKDLFFYRTPQHFRMDLMATSRRYLQYELNNNGLPEEVEDIIASIDILYDFLKKAEKLPLIDLKEQSGLSNKKWDKSIKELTKNNLAKVNKTEEGLFVEVS